MKIQVIYTFKNSEQEISDFENLTSEDLKYEPCFLDILTQSIEDEIKRNDLIKISCCITLDKNENYYPPEYYINANGKFYFENGLKILNT